jgi:heme/copper-type cytochrome/quinol oxidase subunit 2
VIRKRRRVSFSTKKTPDVFFSGVIFAALLGEQVIHACPVCFRVEENATTDGIQAAVIVLGAVTVVVLGAFARFIAGFVKRERRQSGEPEC